MQSRDIDLKATYPLPLDAIVLAGTDSNPRRLIQGQNKAFLELGGQVLIRRVVKALVDSSSIGLIFVVGPQEQLRQSIADLSERVIVVRQAGRMLANTWAAIHAAEARHLERFGSEDPDRPMLFISCDLPLISAAAVDDFVARCASEDNKVENKYSVLAGITEEASLKPYYPDTQGNGIIRPYVHFDRCRARLANIYVGRPRKLSHQDFLQTSFSYRKAKDWHNVVSLAWNFLKSAGGWKATWLTMRFQATLMASKREGWIYRRLRKRNTPERVEAAVSTVLGGSVRMVFSPYGGLSLDVDEEDDYRILGQHLEQWSGIDPVSSDK